MFTAASLNAHLQSGGVVQVTTYLKSTLYQQKHAGMFVQKGERLFVKRGKSLDCLAVGECCLVGIRLGRQI
jgi:hypothetical protein